MYAGAGTYGWRGWRVIGGGRFAKLVAEAGCKAGLVGVKRFAEEGYVLERGVGWG